MKKIKTFYKVFEKRNEHKKMLNFFETEKEAKKYVGKLDEKVGISIEVQEVEY